MPKEDWGTEGWKVVVVVVVMVVLVILIVFVVIDYGYGHYELNIVDVVLPQLLLLLP